MSSSSGRSSSRPAPFSMRRTVFASHGVPSRQGIHLPHDSCAKNSLSRSCALNNAHVVRDDDEACRSECRAGLAICLVRQRNVDDSLAVPGNIGADAPPGMYALSFLPSRRPPARSSSSTRNGVPMFDFVVSRPVDRAADRTDFRARALLGAVRSKPRRAVFHDVRHIGDRFYVVDNGRLAVQALHRWKRRPKSREARDTLRASRAARFPRHRYTRRRPGAPRSRSLYPDPKTFSPR